MERSFCLFVLVYMAETNLHAQTTMLVFTRPKVGFRTAEVQIARRKLLCIVPAQMPTTHSLTGIRSRDPDINCKPSTTNQYIITCSATSPISGDSQDCTAMTPPCGVDHCRMWTIAVITCTPRVIYTASASMFSGLKSIEWPDFSKNTCLFKSYLLVWVCFEIILALKKKGI